MGGARRIVAGAVVALALAGCSRGVAPAAQSSAPVASTAAAGPDAFIAWVRGQVSIGSKSFGAATDEQILTFGNVVCGGFNDHSLSYGRVVQGLMDSVAHPKLDQAEAFIREATVNLCPEYESRLPSGS